MHTLQTPRPTSLRFQVPSVAWSKQAQAHIASRKVTSDELSSSFALVLDTTLNAQPGYTDEEKLKV